MECKVLPTQEEIAVARYIVELCSSKLPDYKFINNVAYRASPPCKLAIEVSSREVRATSKGIVSPNYPQRHSFITLSEKGLWKSSLCTIVADKIGPPGNRKSTYRVCVDELDLSHDDSIISLAKIAIERFKIVLIKHI